MNLNTWKSPVIFIHIPKTGGMSFINFLESKLGKEGHFRLQEEAWRTPPGSWMPNLFTDHLIISGHMPYSNIISDASDASYVTMLRHPVKQVISHYYQIRRPIVQNGTQIQNDESQIIDFAADMTLEEVILQKNINANTYIDNIQVRFLGSEGPCLSAPHFEEEEWQDMLSRAKKRIVSQFEFFGICERMEDTEILFCHTFSIPFHSYEERIINKRPEYQYQGEIDESIKEKIIEQNKYDLLLYDYAQQFFMDRLNEMRQ